ncbi:Transcriptional regulatory protein ZraR [Rosistilla oblonga]|uniref:Transcriptional regulatory protein ZraR n=1 Tax=Rosistilla oblonga TaxID=2527990 RepID=A0A518ISV8_9BACT|nr:sigma-54 dependent transcriptional regulator [Rosistilla oblonga]QDV12177.1 Transcriptional regulatory protein ZraR [Rosistilla oblonga]QDV56177.1 Transcriptional regulatory protein ZraR [Rosistilla oblonga]
MTDNPANKPLPRVLVVDDQQSMCELTKAAIEPLGFDVEWFTDPLEAFAAFERSEFDVVLTDMQMKGLNGIDLCQRIVSNRADVPVVVMTAFGSMETAISAIRAGAYDFVTKPLDFEMLALTLGRAVERRDMQQQIRLLSQQVAAARRGSLDQILGESPVMLRLADQVRQIADSEASVLITGESGSGKEMAAQAIHRLSRRSQHAFVPLNCAALPESLLESELFGHVKGAFTDASTDRQGLFFQADGGTIFLDELGEMPLSMQAKLLRALEQGAARPVGGSTERAFDVRLLTATNRDLEAMVEAGTFREDLFYRINVIQIEMPPLRSRGTDVLILAQHFIDQFAQQANRPIGGLSEAAAQKLVDYNWPGNVRELRNVIQRAVALTRYDRIAPEDLPEKIRSHRGKQVLIGGEDPAELLPMEAVEARYIQHVLEAVDGNKTTAAKILGFDRKTLYRKLRETP